MTLWYGVLEVSVMLNVENQDTLQKIGWYVSVNLVIVG